MPQVMQPNTAQAGCADQPSELPIVIARGQGRAKARRKDQAPVLPKLNARCEPIGLLLLTPHLQGIDHRIRERNDPPRSCCLWRHKVEAFARPVLQRLPHSKNALIKINITPREPQHLPLTQAQQDRDQPARLEPVTRSSCQKQPCLLGVERVNLDRTVRL